jgi:hypothetical protein
MDPDLVALSRLIARLQNGEFPGEAELGTSFLTRLAEILGYRSDQIFFSVWQSETGHIVDAVVSSSRLSTPWLVFELKPTLKGAKHLLERLVASLREALNRNEAHAACLVSPDLLVAIDDHGNRVELRTDAYDTKNLARFASLLAPPDPWVVSPPTRTPDNKLGEALERVRATEDPIEKGPVLEDLAEILFGGIDGVVVKYRDLVTSSSEIDLVLESDPRRCPLFLTDFPRFSLVECKNWQKPVGAPEIRDFVSKIEKSGCKLGFLLSRNGVTGADNSVDALREIRFAADRLGTFVIVLAEDDLVQVANGGSFEDLLDAKFDWLRFDLAHLTSKTRSRSRTR